MGGFALEDEEWSYTNGFVFQIGFEALGLGFEWELEWKVSGLKGTRERGQRRRGLKGIELGLGGRCTYI